MAKKVKTVESKELGDPEMYASLGRQVEAIYNSFPKRVLHMLEDDGMDGKVVLTEEQLADLLREAFILGYECSGESWNGETDPDPEGRREWVYNRETYIHPLVHRSSGGHDDHGREVE